MSVESISESSMIYFHFISIGCALECENAGENAGETEQV
jgi:hypothetical protein